MGRWTEKDPILFDSAQGNLYVYVYNSPINFIDSKGKQVPNINNLITNLIIAQEVIAPQVLAEAAQKASQLPEGVEGLHNGPADAWRHARWNERMKKEVGICPAFLAGLGHEIEGTLRGQPINEAIMDINNNIKGLSNKSPDELLNSGELIIETSSGNIRYSSGESSGTSGSWSSGSNGNSGRW